MPSPIRLVASLHITPSLVDKRLREINKRKETIEAAQVEFQAENDQLDAKWLGRWVDKEKLLELDPEFVYWKDWEQLKDRQGVPLRDYVNPSSQRDPPRKTRERNHEKEVHGNINHLSR